MRFSILAVCLLFAASNAHAQTFKTDVADLIESSCIHCHDAGTETQLNFESLGHDLNQAETFRMWEKVFDRVDAGEMPPESEDRPDERPRNHALDSLRRVLHDASLARQKISGRVPARRLTKLEYGYTVQDLLSIDGNLTSKLPDENDSGSFDTVGESQRISAVHMRSYLQSADDALDHALNLGRKPFVKRELNFNNAFLNEFHDKEISQGGNISRKLDAGVALFADNDYLLTSNSSGFRVTTSGIYRITSRVEAFQSQVPITFKLIAKEPSGGARLLKYADLQPGQPETIVVEAYLNPDDIFYSTLVSDNTAYLVLSAVGSKRYKGKGLAVRSQTVEGPIHPAWPPVSTTNLVQGLDSISLKSTANGPYKIELTKNPIEAIAAIVQRFAPQAFRRPTTESELDSFIHLAKPAIEEGRDFVDVMRIPLRSMLSSPQFLMFAGDPGKLDEFALANRLSYFLWKSMPDETLFALAEQGKLSDPKTLTQQVDRMLDDPKSNRFVSDFLGQWLQLYNVNTTTPDEKLYPEYDELLGNALQEEPELFFTELIKENLSIANLIDSDFTFLNRRLAEHYRIGGVVGQEFRKFELPADSPRGGMLTQAAVLKTTANGTVTSPVTRGNFVLTSLLGTPPSPPPPTIGSIEPDTRGQTTIREILAAHRNIESCNQCHREIDPPGFALESFDPIGGFRTKYRANADSGFSLFGGGRTYKAGPPVDSTGVTADGKPFSDIQEFKQLLLSDKEQIAKHFIAQLVVYSTGGEIQFADRDELKSILDQTRKHDFSVKDILHAVVQSQLFLNQ